MAAIVVDQTLRKKLGDLREAVEFKDESGHLLGHFVPVSIAGGREPHISDEEIEQRLRQGGGRPLSEILADLEKRA
jgi:hypothetical protein